MKKATTVFATIIVLVFTSLPLMAQNIPNPIGYVSDFAGVLSPQAKELMGKEIQTYKDLTGIEIAVVTVPSLQGYEIEVFTLKLAQVWGVGQREKDNGLVLLLAPNEREVRIEVGYGLESDLTDGRAGQILDQSAIPNFKEGKWEVGLSTTTASLISYLGSKTFQTRIAEKETAEQRRLQEQRLQEQKEREFDASFALFLTFAIPIVLVIILIIVIYVWHKNRKIQKQLQIENGIEFEGVLHKFAVFKKQAGEAEFMFARIGKSGQNIFSVRNKYRKLMEEVESVLTTSETKIIPAIKSGHQELGRAQEVSEMLIYFNRTISEAQKNADAIANLPTLILSKCIWVRKNSDTIFAQVECMRKRVQSEASKLDEEFGRKIVDLFIEASENAAKVNIAVSVGENTNSNDWIYMSELLETAEKNSKSVNALIDEYFGLVEKAKKEKVSLIFKLETERTNAEKTTGQSDVKTSTKAMYLTALAKVEPVRQLYPEKEQEWVSFLKRVSALTEEFEKITAQANRDVAEAEEVSRRAKQKEEDARRSRIRASQSSYSDSSRSSGGFGGGGFGGGGASRKF